MARVEENKMLLERMVKEAELKPSGTYNEMVIFHLGAITSILADMSKSLAVIADTSRN